MRGTYDGDDPFCSFTSPNNWSLTHFSLLQRKGIITRNAFLNQRLIKTRNR